MFSNLFQTTADVILSQAMPEDRSDTVPSETERESGRILLNAILLERIF